MFYELVMFTVSPTLTPMEYQEKSETGTRKPPFDVNWPL